MDNASVLIRALENIPPGGFEPPIFSLGNCCSIHLSYGGPMVLQYLGEPHFT